MVNSFGDAYNDEKFERNLKTMKNYILQCKEVRRRTRDMDESDKRKKKQIRGDTFLFILEDAKRLLSDLEAVLRVEAASLEEKELVERSKELADVEKKVENIAVKITEMLAYSSMDGKDEWEIRAIKKRYEDLVAAKTTYMFQMKKEIRERELDKEEIFKEAKLNIKLPKFN